MSVLIKNPTTVVSSGIQIQKLDENASGTTVPNSGVVNSVYLNKFLKDEQVIEILQNANFEENQYYVLTTTDETENIGILHWVEDSEGWGILHVNTETGFQQVLWCDENLFSIFSNIPELNLTHSGWQDFTNPILINKEVSSDVGTLNESLKSVISITEYAVVVKDYRGMYNGETLQANVGGEYFDGKTVDVEKMLDSQKLPLNIDVEYAKIKVDDTKVDLIGEYDGTPISVSENVDMQSLINEGKIPLSIEILGGGLEINGLIKEYQVYAGENISAGDFVEYLNKIEKQLNSASNSCWNGLSCILLEANKVFIAHNYSSSQYLYGTIVEINGTEMTPTTTQLNTNANSCWGAPSCVLLEANKVFIAHAYNSSRYLYGTIVEINGTEMTPTTTQLSSGGYSCNRVPSCILLENNKVFIAHSYSSGGVYLYGTIVEIDGTTMTPTTTRLNSTQFSCYLAPSCILLEANKVFIAHCYAEAKYLYGTIVEIDGTTMTPTTTRLNSNANSCNDAPSCILLEANKVFIAHNYSSSQYLYGTIVEINGTEMTPTTTQLNTNANSCWGAPSCVLLEANKVFIAHAYNSSRYLYGTIVEIDGTTMTPTTTQLNSTQFSCYFDPSCILLEANKVFIAHRYAEAKYLYGTIYLGGYKVKKYNNLTTFGVAKQSGTSGDTIQVYVPNEE